MGVIESHGKKYNCSVCKDSKRVMDTSTNRLVKCPNCSSNNLPEFVGEDIVAVLREKYIPENYRGITYSKDSALTYCSYKDVYKNSAEVKSFLSNCEKIYDRCVVGGKFSGSIFLSSPQGMGKTHLVYACIDALLSIGKSVAKYYDSLEIHGMLYHFKENYQNEIEELCSADMCFIKLATGLTNLPSNFQAIRLIVDRRARAGLPTIVVSRYNTSYIKKIENSMDSFIITNREYGIKDFSVLKAIEAPFTT